MPNNPIIPKVWVTTYALTTGILAYENVEHCTSISDNMIAISTGSGGRMHYHRPHWHASEAEANRRTLVMIAKAEHSLKKRQVGLAALRKKYEALVK